MAKPTDAPRPRHFSMLRDFELADLLTLANAACGVGAVLAAMTFGETGVRAWYWVACALAPLALFFDTLDGRVARWQRRRNPELGQSLFGRELDSLADVVSFGVAPAALAHAAGMRGGWDHAVLIYFVVCGVSRLARFNVTADALAAGGDKVRYFEGTPIPTSVLLVGVLALAAARDRIGAALPFGELTLGPFRLHPLVLLWALSGSLMVSKTLRIPKP
jgi:CDP-diacylglycerol--serine O-phosphatidyltransferase